MGGGMNKASFVVVDPWDGQQFLMADEVFETERPTHSKLLGPDGRPIPYVRQKLGFDLTPKRKATP
jgi:hypothetical protein